ncbi:sugar phosphate isomerase/epimerase family protein [Peribacillus butanolivorans]|uniref:sugar phosphate isomerase/epimerase family protein n=1 Tax=Peribacillus butanolivorans TaxID=421767 RepID=UPI00365968F1
MVESSTYQFGEMVGMNFDPSHLFWMGGDPISALRELGSAVYHVHAKDVRLERGIYGVEGLMLNQCSASATGHGITLRSEMGMTLAGGSFLPSLK